MPKIANSAAPQFDLHGVTFTSIAAPSRGTLETSLWRASVAPGPGVLHHMTREEIILATSGEGLVRIDGETHRLTPGDVFAIPPFTDFQLEAAGDERFEAIVTLPVGGRAVIAGQPAFQPPWSV